MGSNVVYNEASGSWVASGSSDDTTSASTSTNKNYGLSAHEVNYKNQREFREKEGIKTIDSKKGESAKDYMIRLNATRKAERLEREKQKIYTVHKDGKTANILGSSKFGAKLTKAMEEEQILPQECT
jgi:hypothetical protein